MNLSFPQVFPILLLVASNIVMTFAWYGHLRYLPGRPLGYVILVSWGIALLEYCLAVPANRLGYGVYTGFELKILQEIITVSVFSLFAIWILGERLSWNYILSFVCLGLAVWFAFGFKPAASAPDAAHPVGEGITGSQPHSGSQRADS